MDDSIRLQIVQHTLTGVATKWYIELPHATYPNFSSLASMLLKYIKLPVHYDEVMETMLSCRQTTATHIMDHIHEWRHHHSLCKVQLDESGSSLIGFLNPYSPITNDFPSMHQQIKEE